jgi:hypothetical protein
MRRLRQVGHDFCIRRSRLVTSPRLRGEVGVAPGEGAIREFDFAAFDRLAALDIAEAPLTRHAYAKAPAWRPLPASAGLSGE